MALRLDVLANTRQFVQEMKKSGASVEDITDSLDEMAKDGERGTEKLERSFKELAREAKQTDREVEKIGDSGKKGFGIAGDATAEFKDEAKSNFSEVTSSFDGSMSSIQDLIQGTLGGLASTGLPGIGIAAGAAAIAVGTIGAAITANDEAMQLSQERVGEWADKYVEAQGKILQEQQVLDEVQRILNEDTEAYNQALQIQEQTGLSLGTVLRAMGGDSRDLATVTDTLRTKLEENRLAMEQRRAEGERATREQRENRDAINENIDALTRQEGEMAEAKTRYDALSQAAERGTQKVDELRDSLLQTTSPEPVDILINVNTDAAYQRIQRLKDFIRRGELFPVTSDMRGARWD